MPKYLVLYRSSATPDEQMSGATPEQMQEGMAPWMKWFEKTGPALTDFGSPLGKAQTLPGKADTGLPIGGYSIVEADSPAAAKTLLDDHPHLHAPDAAIEVLEFLPMPGM